MAKGGKQVGRAAETVIVKIARPAFGKAAKTAGRRASRSAATRAARTTGGSATRTAARQAKDKAIRKYVKGLWKQGRKFNETNWHRFRANEIPLKQAAGAKGKKVLDSYVPGRAIVSRKFTQLSKIKPKTLKGYLGELTGKYKAGTKILDGPKARREFPDLAGKPLQGKLVLEIPKQKAPVPQWAIDMAREKGVILRELGKGIHR